MLSLCTNTTILERGIFRLTLSSLSIACTQEHTLLLLSPQSMAGNLLYFSVLFYISVLFRDHWGLMQSNETNQGAESKGDRGQHCSHGGEEGGGGRGRGVRDIGALEKGTASGEKRTFF